MHLWNTRNIRCKSNAKNTKMKYCNTIIMFTCGAIKNDSVYGEATMTLKSSSGGACAVVAGSLFHNMTVLGKNEKACWSILESLRDVVFVTCVIFLRCKIEGGVKVHCAFYRT